MNKVSDQITSYTGDSKKIAKKLRWKNKADRVIMNLPMSAKDFLDTAFYIAKPGAIVHFYCFLETQKGYKEGIKTIKNAEKEFKRKTRILNKRICGKQSPGTNRAVIDFRIY